MSQINLETVNRPDVIDRDPVPATGTDAEQDVEGVRPIESPTESFSAIAVPILVMHLLGIVALLPMFWSWWNLVLLIVSTLVFGQGINLGYHRILTHRSLVVPRWLERLYVVMALCCLEETPGKWVSTHRRHHRHSDQVDDPHSPTHSVLWSHIGWLFRSRNGKQEFAFDDRYAADIMQDRFYRTLEHNPFLPGLIYLIHAAVHFGIAWGLAYFSGMEHPLWLATNVLLWAVVLRTIVVWHISWSVNSLAHRFGYQNYDTGEQSRNNWLVALLSSGEGWHNNHHHDQASASNRHRWWELDLTYVHIRVLEFLGLATQVIRPRCQRKQQR